MRPSLLSPLAPAACGASPLHVYLWPVAVLFFLFGLLQAGVPVGLDSLAGPLAGSHAPRAVTDPHWLAALGLDPGKILAGLCGGFVRMARTARNGGRFADWALRCVVGAVAGNYLSSVPGLFSAPLADFTAAAAIPLAFVLGYGAETFLSRFESASAPTGPTPPPDGPRLDTP